MHSEFMPVAKIRPSGSKAATYEAERKVKGLGGKRGERKNNSCLMKRKPRRLKSFTQSYFLSATTAFCFEHTHPHYHHGANDADRSYPKLLTGLEGRFMIPWQLLDRRSHSRSVLSRLPLRKVSSTESDGEIRNQLLTSWSRKHALPR